MKKEINLAGRTIFLTGNEADPYFANIEAFFHGAPSLLHYATRHLPQDAICLDVGANVGLTALLLASHCERGHVYAFEPTPASYDFLVENLELNAITNCTPIHAAVGDSCEPVTLFSGPAPAGNYVFADREWCKSQHTVSVRCTTLDAFMESPECIHDRIDFIKLDVEGFEPMVLDGARELITRQQPPILMEFNSWCLMYCHDIRLFHYARALWDAFLVYRVGVGGELELLGSPISFLHQNLVKHHCVDDILVMPRPGAETPSLR